MQPTDHELTDARAIVTMPEVFAQHVHARQVAWMALKANQGHPITPDRERRLQGSGAVVHSLVRRNAILEETARARDLSAVEACTLAARPAVARAVAHHMPCGPTGDDAA